MAKKNEIFQFNLLPAPAEKPGLYLDNSILYGFALIFIGIVVFLLLFLVQILLLNPQISRLQAEADLKSQTINEFAQVQETYGELVVKTNTLKAILEKDINSEEIFRVADEIENSSESLALSRYERQTSGAFVFEVITADFDAVTDLAEYVQTIENVENVFIVSAQDTSDGYVRVNLQLDIINTASV